ncbi:hypothetical protein BGZ61DRAFT_532296 [Ilyonectria robusta]|uniref:uncharacterized protein n=1 Tax=Ilyonectria robusta TaxID=1079257 RepID=UPI001E8EDA16|nr:uncharacterized protein BGZ61DRAFT_532296 [Ilyonectria robusta]KAH8699841.1 hypothetical protein BGZ61DRAFT_532296 [Ilyonectria robusta]
MALGSCSPDAVVISALPLLHPGISSPTASPRFRAVLLAPSSKSKPFIRSPEKPPSSISPHPVTKPGSPSVSTHIVILVVTTTKRPNHDILLHTQSQPEHVMNRCYPTTIP